MRRAAPHCVGPPERDVREPDPAFQQASERAGGLVRHRRLSRGLGCRDHPSGRGGNARLPCGSDRRRNHAIYGRARTGQDRDQGAVRGSEKNHPEDDIAASLVKASRSVVCLSLFCYMLRRTHMSQDELSYAERPTKLQEPRPRLSEEFSVLIVPSARRP